MKKFIHIGYYNDVEDIMEYAHLTTDEIVDKMRYGLGNFYYTWDDEPVDCITNYETTTDGEYIVVREFTDKDLLAIDNANPQKIKHWDYFIDICRVVEVEDKDNPTEKIAAKKAVSGQIINMLVKNFINEYGNETFEGWCKDGAVFKNAYPNATKEFYEECEKLMKEVAPLVDKLTYDHLAEF